MSNYIITYNTAELHHHPAQCNLGYDQIPHSKTYGNADPVPVISTGSGSNFVDTVTATYARVAGETVAGGPLPQSPQRLDAGAGVLANYNITNNTARTSPLPKGGLGNTESSD